MQLVRYTIQRARISLACTRVALSSDCLCQCLYTSAFLDGYKAWTFFGIQNSIQWLVSFKLINFRICPVVVCWLSWWMTQNVQHIVLYIHKSKAKPFAPHNVSPFDPPSTSFSLPISPVLVCSHWQYYWILYYQFGKEHCNGIAVNTCWQLKFKAIPFRF